MEALLLAAEHDGPLMFARIGMMRRCTGTGPRKRQRRAGSAPRLTGSFDDRDQGEPLTVASAYPTPARCLPRSAPTYLT